MLEQGAERSPENSPALRKLAVMLRAEQLANERLARNYLVQQRDSSSDPRLREMLDKRVQRLEGLLVLREAQRAYEKDHGPLQEIPQLVEQGLLPMIPIDPLRLGYELKDGLIQLQKLKIAGMENQP